ncbi:MAG: glycosyltransferase family 39 protein, partial [Afipia sp.]
MGKANTAGAMESERLTPRAMLAAGIVIAVVVTLQVVYAAIADLRTDEAYYWTLSRENVLSYLD